jgi:hypothetical protein
MERGGGVPAPISTAPGVLRTEKVASLREQRAEIEGTGGVAALVGAPVCRFCAGQVTTLLAKDTQVGRSGCVPLLVRAPEGSLGSSEVTLLSERSTKLERLEPGDARGASACSLRERRIAIGWGAGLGRGPCVGWYVAAS